MNVTNRLFRSLFKRTYRLISRLSTPQRLNHFLLWGSRSSRSAIKNFSKSKLVINRHELQAIKLGVGRKQRINFWWAYKPLPGNLGDSLNPHLLEFLTGLPPIWCQEGEGMMMIGSTIERAKSGCLVWGSGLISMTSQFNGNCEFMAVRGPHTRQKLLDSGANCPEVYGDPAILLPLFMQPKKTTNRSKIGVIPHFQHQNYTFQGSDLIISVDRATIEDFQEFVEEINQCQFVFSSSLHGLILCRAYQIPCARIVFDQDKLSGDDTKFADYRLGVGLKSSHFPQVTYSLDTLWDANLAQSLPPDEPFTDFAVKTLLDNFPYPEKLINAEHLKQQVVKV